MRELEDAARAATTGAIREVGVFGGFPYADTVHTGASVFVVSDASRDPEGARPRERADAMMDRIRAPCAGIRRAAALTSPRRSPRRLRSHAAGTDRRHRPRRQSAVRRRRRHAGLFRALLEARAGVPALFASFADPAVVAAARRAGTARSLDVDAGRTLRDAVRRRRHVARDCRTPDRRHIPQRGTDGERRRAPLRRKRAARRRRPALASRDRHRAGRSRGRPGVLCVASASISASLRLLCVKAKNHFRAAFAPALCRHHRLRRTRTRVPRLTKLPFRNVRPHAP